MDDQILSPEQVAYVAVLARLKLDSRQTRELGREMAEILDYMRKLGQLDTRDISPTSHVLDLLDPLRPDEVTPSLSREEALANAPRHENGQVIVPRILE